MAAILRNLGLNPNLGGQGFLNIPFIVINSLGNCGCWYSSFLRPIAQCKRLIVKCNISCGRFISALFFGGFPFNIARLVTNFIINPSKGMAFRRSVTNILQKVKKISPSITNLNADTAVSIVSLHRGVFAPPNHGVPCSPLFRSLSVFCMSVLAHVNPFGVMRSHYTTKEIN
jgi:hypothetical protein